MDKNTGDREYTLEWALYTAARLAAEDAGKRFSVPCSNNVRDLAKTGARNMVRSGRTGAADLAEAEGNMGQLVGAMAKDAARVSGDLIRENSLVAAKRLCPLWPFP